MLMTRKNYDNYHYCNNGTWYFNFESEACHSLWAMHCSGWECTHFIACSPVETLMFRGFCFPAELIFICNPRNAANIRLNAIRSMLNTFRFYNSLLVFLLWRIDSEFVDPASINSVGDLSVLAVSSQDCWSHCTHQALQEKKYSCDRGPLNIRSLIIFFINIFCWRLSRT